MPHTATLDKETQALKQPGTFVESTFDRFPQPETNTEQSQKDALSSELNDLNLACTLCGGSMAARVRMVFDRLHHTPGIHRIASCVHCGHQQTISPWTPEDVALAYPPYYLARAMSQASPSWRQRLFNYFIQQNEKARAKFVKEHAALDDNWCVLDIGCGNGGFLSEMRSLTEARCLGLEMDAGAAHEANAREGLTVTCGTLEKDLPKYGSMDLVTLWHVLEHLTDPVEALRAIGKTVRPGGYMAIGVPDNAGWTARAFKDYWFGCDAPRHRSHFTESSLRVALTKAGWNPIEFRHITEVSTIAGSLHNVCRRRWCDDLPAHLIRWCLLQGMCLPFDHLLRKMGQGDWLIALAQRPQ